MRLEFARYVNSFYLYWRFLILWGFVILSSILGLSPQVFATIPELVVHTSHFGSAWALRNIVKNAPVILLRELLFDILAVEAFQLQVSRGFPTSRRTKIFPRILNSQELTFLFMKKFAHHRSKHNPAKISQRPESEASLRGCAHSTYARFSHFYAVWMSLSFYSKSLFTEYAICQPTDLFTRSVRTIYTQPLKEWLQSTHKP